MVTTSDASFLEYHRQAGSRAALRASSPRMRVALAQVDVVPGEYDANLPRIKRIIDEQRGQADLLVFPEYTFSGYQTARPSTTALCVSTTPSSRSSSRPPRASRSPLASSRRPAPSTFTTASPSFAMARWSASTGIYLVNYGAFEERKYFSVGPRHQSLHLDDFRLTPFICADVWTRPSSILPAATERISSSSPPPAPRRDSAAAFPPVRAGTA